MQLINILFIILLLLFASGCEKDMVYKGIYEGMKHRERMINPSDDPTSQEQPSYEEYKRERDRLEERE